MKWMIFFLCSLSGEQLDGKIEITQDSVKALGLTWTVEKIPGTYLEGRHGFSSDLVDRAELALKSDTLKANLTVSGKDVWMRIKGVGSIYFEQLPHTNKMYALHKED